MSKVKKTGFSRYEILFIIPNKYTEDEAIKIDKKIKDIIISKEGKIVYFEDWGKKKLAYQIKHFSYGYYKLVEFDLAGENLAKIDKELRMSLEILRHQIVKKEIKTKKQIEKEKDIVEKIAKKSIKNKKKDDEEKKEVKDDKKLKLKDLDKKLDSILETDDLI